MKKRFILLTQVHTQITSSNLQSQGRLDIVLHSIITSLFISHEFRKDTILEIICMGPPLKPRRVSIEFNEEQNISKKNLKKTIELALKKCRSSEEVEVHPGVKVKEINIDLYVEEILENSINYNCILDSYGELISNYRNSIKQILTTNETQYNHITFFLGDHEGITKNLRKQLKKKCNRISLGQNVYFTSQVCTILQYEMDLLEFETISEEVTNND